MAIYDAYMGSFVGKNIGLEYPAFEGALKNRGISYNERQIETWCGLYELTYTIEDNLRHAYVKVSQYDSDAWAQDVFIFNDPLPMEYEIPIVLALWLDEKDSNNG